MAKSQISLFIGVTMMLFGPMVWAESPVSVTGGVIRGMPPGQPNSAAYLTIRNSGTQPVALVGAYTAVARRVEIHRTREVDGLMRMEKLEGLTISPGEDISLKPGGTHLMLFDIEGVLVPGDNHSLCLEFEARQSVCVEAEVRKPGEELDAHHHHH